MNRCFIGFLLNILLISCSNTQSFVSNDISIKYHPKIINTSELLDSCKIVIPQSDEKQQYIGNIERVLCANNKYYLVDRKRNAILSFNEEGHFEKTTASLIGRGPGEYIRILDAAVDLKSNRIYVYCDAPYQMMIFDYNLNLVEVVKVELLFKEFAIDGDYIFALCQNVDDWSKYELRCYNKTDINGSYKVLAKQDKGIAGTGGLGKSVTYDGRNCYFCLPFDNKIYRISNGEIENGWNLDFNGKWFSYEASRQLKGTRFITKNKDVNWYVQNLCVSDSLVLFNTNLSNIFVVNKKLNVGDSYSEIINDIFPYSSSWIIPVNGQPSKMCFIVPCVHAKRVIDHIKEDKNNLIYNKIKQKISDYDANDNPLILVWDIKQ